MNPNPPSASFGDAPPDEDHLQVLTADGRRKGFRRESIRSHDFRQSAFLAPSEMRRIKMRHEQFVRALAARLSIYLRMECTVRIAKLHIIAYQAFTESLPTPTHITLFKAEPLKGVSLLVIPPRLGLAIVDRQLGGPGTAPETGRDLSEIETALLDQTSQIILTEWCNLWHGMKELRPTLLGHENNSRFLQTAPADTAMLALALETSLGELQEQWQLVFPYHALEPLIRLLSPATLPDNEAAPVAAPKARWNPEFNEIRVPVTAAWNGLQLTAREITQLKVGDVLVLGPQCAQRVQVRLAQVPKFVGRLGTCGSRWAVALSDAVKS